MPFGVVTVTFPGRRRVYINGNYTPDTPQTIECELLVEYGANVFETVNGDGRVDYRGSVTINGSNRRCSLELEPVSPPQPKRR